MDIESAINAALLNITKHGDTDVFPFPYENHIFFDSQKECKDLLLEIHNDFEKYLATCPPATIETLTQVGYTGFRWASQIEPFWNAYYLALVISLAEKIEAQRIPSDKNIVFSYRYKWNPDEAKLFTDSTWHNYKIHALEQSKKAKFVVVTDVADFYTRIYHHRIENALQRLESPGDIPKRIMQLLSTFSKNVSYGLPIGGPASRILSELALISTDLLLVRSKIHFCRYADDYAIFCNGKSDAYRILVNLSEKLFNEGLALQKKKTKILSAEEYREMSSMLDPDTEKAPFATEEQKLLSISIRFDPYSATATEDYEALKDAVQEIDIIGILGREVAKTTIDAIVTKQAISAIRALDPISKLGAIKTLLNPENLNALLPVFVTVMRAVRGVYDDLPIAGKDYVDKALIELYESQSHLLSVELNLSYYVQALSKRNSHQKEEILIELFNGTTKPLIRRLVILTMANWNCHYWLSDIKQQYGVFTGWEKRAFILASYYLGDEGRHWRDHTRDSWNPMETIIRDWFSKRFQTNKTVPL